MASTITMTNTDPGEGSPLPTDNYLAVYGGDALLDIFYPIGSTYKSYSTTFDPNITWGGVWEELPESNGENIISTIFEFSGKFSAENGTVVKKTNKGTLLTFGWADNGQDLAILDGASDIFKVKSTYSIYSPTQVTSHYGVFGISSETVWTNWTGVRNDAGGSGHLSYPADGPTPSGSYSVYYATLCDMSGSAKISTYGKVECVRRFNTNKSWGLIGQMGSSGSGNGINFLTECSAVSQSAVPNIYQRGMQSFTNVYHSFEVFESTSGKGYKIWRRIA